MLDVHHAVIEAWERCFGDAKLLPLLGTWTESKDSAFLLLAALHFALPVAVWDKAPLEHQRAQRIAQMNKAKF